MYHVALLFLACILAGFALASLPGASILTAGLVAFFKVIGVIVIIVFALALIYLGFKTLFNKKHWH